MGVDSLRALLTEGQACCGPGAHGRVHVVGDVKLPAGVQHDGRDGRVVRVAHVGEQVVHHLRTSPHRRLWSGTAIREQRQSICATCV